MNADEIARILDELGNRLGPAGAYVFELALRQVYINALVATLALGALAVLGVIVGPRAYRWFASGDSYSDRDFLGALAGAGYAVLVVFAGIVWLRVATAVLNPEYAAITDLLTRIVP